MGTLLMSTKERLRIEVLARVRDGTMKLSEAASRLGVSYRQMRRVRRRHTVEGDAGLMHGLRGVASNHGTAPAVRDPLLRRRADR